MEFRFVVYLIIYLSLIWWFCLIVVSLIKVDKYNKMLIFKNCD